MNTNKKKKGSKRAYSWGTQQRFPPNFTENTFYTNQTIFRPLEMHT